MPLYKPLDADSCEIRLLTLRRGPPGSIIRCRLNRVKLLRVSDFSALSYCWGDESIKRNIIINGVQIAVTSNLEDALQRLRDLHVDRVWADAVCINQANKQERSNQVRIMKQIYARAKITYAWLGRSDKDGTVAAMKLLRSIRTNTRGDIIAAHSHELLDFFEQEYWKRRWIIQEITSAVTVHILCGTDTISLTELADALTCLQNSSSWRSVHDIASLYLQRVFRFRNAYHAGNTFSICKAVLRTRDFRSKDPRDKIFALIGICSDGLQLVPLPNYSQDPADVVRNFSRELLRKHVCFDIILMDTRQRISLSWLPTWVPDWLSTTLPRDAHEIAYDSPLLDHSYVLDALRGDFDTLTVRGVQLGTIVSLSSVVGSSIAEGSMSRHDNRDRRRIDTISSARAYYGGRRYRVTQAVIRCLISHDQEPHGTGVHGWTRHLFYRYVQRALNNHVGAENNADLSPDVVYARWLRENRNFTVDQHRLERYWQDDQLSKWAYVIAGYYTWPIISFLLFFILILCVLPAIVLAHLHPGITKAWLWCLVIGLLLLGLAIVILTAGICCRGFSKPRVKRNMERASRLERRLAVTAHGMLAMVSPHSQVGDKICLIAGCSSAAVLRKVRTPEDQTRYQVVGKAFACVSTRDYVKYEGFIRDSRFYPGMYATGIKEYGEQYGWDWFVLI